MAYDTTSLTTAIAQGRVDETAARELIQESQDLEIKIAKLLETADAEQARMLAEQPQEVAEPVVETVETVETPTEG